MLLMAITANFSFHVDKASHVALLPSELELARIVTIGTRQKLLPALEALQVHLGRQGQGLV